MYFKKNSTFVAGKAESRYVFACFGNKLIAVFLSYEAPPGGCSAFQSVGTFFTRQSVQVLWLLKL